MQTAVSAPASLSFPCLNAMLWCWADGRERAPRKQRREQVCGLSLQPPPTAKVFILLTSAVVLS